MSMFFRPSKIYPPEKAFNINPAISGVRSPLGGLEVNPATGDVAVHTVYTAVGRNSSLIWNALGYLDVIEEDTGETRLRLVETQQQLADTQEAVKVVQSQIADLRASLDRLVDFLAVSIPAWINKTEVENGDDMGISRPSAASLELTVDFQFDRQVAGFGHEDVISIDPPAGTLVKRGSSITVTLNLEG